MQFSIFQAEKNFRHAISTRAGGVSSGDFEDLNLALHVGDDAERVRENRRRFATEAGYSAENLVCARQVHGESVRVVGANERGRGSFDFGSALPDCDALLTRESGLPLLILVADCAPVLLVDPINRACAVVHAGWRGALAGIAGKTVRTMEREFGTNASDVLAAIGPCLNIENLEVGEEVAAQVEKKDARCVVRRPEWEKPHLDLRGMIGRDLAGVGITRIEISPLCPRERNDLFFSHRGQNGRAGRFGVVAWFDL